MGYGKGWVMRGLNSIGNPSQNVFPFCFKMKQSHLANLRRCRQWWHLFFAWTARAEPDFQRACQPKTWMNHRWRMKNKSKKWRQTGRWFLGRGWNRARPNSARNKCRKCFPLCFILKQLPLPVLPEWFHEFIFRSGCGKGLGHAVVEFRRESRPKNFSFCFKTKQSHLANLRRCRQWRPWKTD